MKYYSLQDIAETFGLKLRGDPGLKISGIAPIEKALPHQAAFLENPRYQKYLETTNAGVVILSPAYADQCKVACLVSETPYLSYAKLAELFIERDLPPAGIHSLAIVDATASIHPSAAIGPYVVIGKNVSIGPHVIIGAGCFIGASSQIGEATLIWPHVNIYYHTEIGSHCEIKSGAVIGGDGFGFAPSKTGWHKIPQLGRVIIGDKVSIGSNTTIDRGSTQDTSIGNGVIIDNQVQIAHNVSIGENTAIAGCVAIAGSTSIGKHCQIGGGSGITGHIEIADYVGIAAMSGVTKSIDSPGHYIGRGGMGIDSLKNWLKLAAKLRGIDKLIERIKKLEGKH